MAETTPVKRPRGWWYPWIFVAFFAVVISVNGVMIFLAVDTFPGLETEKHYVQGLNYNEALHAMERQEKLGWTAEFAFETEGDKKALLALEMRGPDGAPLDDLSVRAILQRPVGEEQEDEIMLTPQGEGRYTAENAFSLPGQWTVKIYASRGDDLYHLSKRVKVQ
ncbi:MAG: FixH family protein [Magnetospiraceae bacterium]